MALTTQQFPANGGNAYFASGTIVDTGADPAALVINLGFKPKYFRLFNVEAAGLNYELFEGPSGYTCVLDTAGVKSIVTTTAALALDETGVGNQSGTPGTPQAGTLVVTDDTRTQTVGTAPSFKVNVGSAVLVQNKLYAWIAIGA